VEEALSLTCLLSRKGHQEPSMLCFENHYLVVGSTWGPNWTHSEYKWEKQCADNNCRILDGEQKIITLKKCHSIFCCPGNIGKGK
jgi:hypothetical protein